jgi:hypothetical protein
MLSDTSEKTGTDPDFHGELSLTHARQARVVVAGVPHHITQRGNR